MILVTCRCGQRLQARDEHAGRSVKCPACGQILTIPNQSPPLLVVADPISAEIPTHAPPPNAIASPAARRMPFWGWGLAAGLGGLVCCLLIVCIVLIVNGAGGRSDDPEQQTNQIEPKGSKDVPKVTTKPNPRKVIVGRWRTLSEPTNVSLDNLVFYEDGVVEDIPRDLRLEVKRGTYLWVDEKHVEIDFPHLASSVRYGIEFFGNDDMHLVFPTGKRRAFRRGIGGG